MCCWRRGSGNRARFKRSQTRVRTVPSRCCPAVHRTPALRKSAGPRKSVVIDAASAHHVEKPGIFSLGVAYGAAGAPSASGGVAGPHCSSCR